MCRVVGRGALLGSFCSSPGRSRPMTGSSPTGRSQPTPADRGPLRLESRAADVRFASPADLPRAATFNGESSKIDVPDHPRLRFGKGDFSIALWAHTSDQLDDVLGDLVSKYDPRSRRGFQFGVQCRPGVTSSQSNDRHLHFGIDAGRQSAWMDHGRLGAAVWCLGSPSTKVSYLPEPAKRASTRRDASSVLTVESGLTVARRIGATPSRRSPSIRDGCMWASASIAWQVRR